MQGSCLCGEVVFEIMEPLPALYQCHCSLCRKQTGASASAALALNSNQFCWLEGQHLVSTYKRVTGFTSSFCSKCGSPVPNKIGESDFVWIPAGLLDSTVSLNISAHLFIGSMAAWESVPANGKCFNEMPPLTEIVGYLYEQAHV